MLGLLGQAKGHGCYPPNPLKNGDPAGIRTQGHLIKSQVLYQLSYGIIGLARWLSGPAVAAR